MKVKVNQRKNGKYAQEREWAYDLIVNSTGTTASEMADLMAEQFGHPKGPMSHTLSNMVDGGSLKVTGYAVRNGKRTFVLAANKRQRPKEELARVDLPNNEPLVNKVHRDAPAQVTNGSGVSVVIDTAAGPVTLTVEQAKAINSVLGSLFK